MTFATTNKNVLMGIFLPLATIGILPGGRNAHQMQCNVVLCFLLGFLRGCSKVKYWKIQPQIFHSKHNLPPLQETRSESSHEQKAQ